jgi:WD repeat and SOF domain-containing protein 1
MKIKLINRDEEAMTRERAQDVVKVHRNLDPTLRPMNAAREYTRALNAAKLERVFAKPFLAALPHSDGVTCLARNPRVLNSLVSGAADGELTLWDIPVRRALRRLEGHRGAVRGCCFAPDGETLLSAGTDATVKLWRVPYAPLEGAPPEVVPVLRPALEFHGKQPFRAIDHRGAGGSGGGSTNALGSGGGGSATTFATAAAGIVEVWDHNRALPVSSYTWGADSVSSVRFNPAEPDIFATTGSDRSVALYDLRSRQPLRKLIMQTRANAVAWNPIEAFNFTVASEDCNLYSFDMRRLQGATCVHQDFVSAVMDVDYSPTGREFVAGSYDRSVRIFAYNGGHSREVYHTRRMQRVFAVRFSGDGSYVFSGSDDMNVRVWKAEASSALGVALPREKHAAAYRAALVARHKHLPEIKRIVRHRHLPKPIVKAQKLRRVVRDSERRKTERRVAHSKPGSVPLKPERRKKIVAVVD